MTDATVILDAIRNGRPEAAADLLPLVYDELRKLAAFHLSAERPGNTLQPTALVHEAWMRLVGGEDTTFENRRHFFGAASEAMRRILVDRARRRLAAKRGTGSEHVDIDQIELASDPGEERLLQVHDALDRLAREDATAAEVVKLRFFVGFSNDETAAVLGVNEKTVRRHWNHARIWLYENIKGSA